MDFVSSCIYVMVNPKVRSDLIPENQKGFKLHTERHEQKNHLLQASTEL